jgi:hypothetical protein
VFTEKAPRDPRRKIRQNKKTSFSVCANVHELGFASVSSEVLELDIELPEREATRSLKLGGQV